MRPRLPHRSSDRHPAVAGQFYPSDPKTLRRDVEGYLDSAQGECAMGRVASIITPHAGYRFSGATAGHAFARVRSQAISRVVLLGCSHRHRFEGVSVWSVGGFGTPLGSSPIDEAFCQRLAEGCAVHDASPHLMEHTLEVQIPFVQVCFGEIPIVPLLFGGENAALPTQVAAFLARELPEDALVVISTDLSHYLTQSEAERIDRHTLKTILEQDPAVFAHQCEKETCSACGMPAVVAGMHYAKARGANNWNLLDYRTSAAASGDETRVVGYGAVSMEYGE